MHKSQLLLVGLLGIMAGIAICSFLGLPGRLLWMLFSIGMACLLWPNPKATAAGIFLVSALLGMWRTQAVLERRSPLADFVGTDVVLDGYVDGDFSPTKIGGQFYFHVARINGSPADDRAVIFGSDSVRPRYGQVYSISGKLQAPKNSGDFDYASYLAKNGTHGLMYYPQYSVPLDWSPDPLTGAQLVFVGYLHGIRDSMAASIGRAVPQPEAAYLAGIIVGAQGIVPQDIKEMFSRTGTSHILAISGYNITIVAGVLSLLLAPLGRRRAFWSASVGIIAFTLMVGASASVVRAALMGVLALAAGQFGRQARPGILILLSAAAMCMYNPLLLRWDVGFQLSFLALIGIVYIEPLIKPALSRVLHWEWLSGTIATTASASLMVLPLLLFNFNQLAVYTLPANVIVLPLVPLAMLLGFTTAVVGAIVPVLGQIIGQLAWLVAAFQLNVIKFFASLPFAAPQVNISWAVMLASYTGIAAWLILSYRGRGTVLNT